MRAGAAIGPVEGVRITEIERQVVVRIRVHLPRRDRIEAFRRLPVAFLDLRAKLARPAADRIGLQQRVPPRAVLLPDLEFGLFLEEPHQDRRLLRHVLGFDFRLHLVGQRRERAAGGHRGPVGVAAGKRHRNGQRRGREQRAHQGAAVQRLSPPTVKRSPNHHRTIVSVKIPSRQAAENGSVEFTILW